MNQRNNNPNVTDLRESLLHREAEIDLLQQTFTEIGSELDLDRVSSDIDPDHMRSYRELLNGDAEQWLENGGKLSDRQREQIQTRTPLGRLGTVEDLLPWVEFLLADGSRFMTGQVVTVDGGASV